MVKDTVLALDKILPIKGNYKHFEGNSHAHLKSSCFGVEKIVIINEAKLILGTWQSVYFCEFDVSRSRQIFVKAISN